jgi:hypothetical protein
MLAFSAFKDWVDTAADADRQMKNTADSVQLAYLPLDSVDMLAVLVCHTASEAHLKVARIHSLLLDRALQKPLVDGTSVPEVPFEAD